MARWDALRPYAAARWAGCAGNRAAPGCAALGGGGARSRRGAGSRRRAARRRVSSACRPCMRLPPRGRRPAIERDRVATSGRPAPFGELTELRSRFDRRDWPSAPPCSVSTWRRAPTPPRLHPRGERRLARRTRLGVAGLAARPRDRGRRTVRHLGRHVVAAVADACRQRRIEQPPPTGRNSVAPFAPPNHRHEVWIRPPRPGKDRTDKSV